MRTILFFVFLFSSFALYAIPCNETQKWNTEILPEIKKIQDLDIQGDEDLDVALANLQKISKKDNEQMSAYSLELLNKPEFAELQKQRQDVSLKNLSLIMSEDCKEIIENYKKLESVVSQQWLVVLDTVQADAQVYLAKSGESSPNIDATANAEKKAIFRTNGVLTDETKKELYELEEKLHSIELRTVKFISEKEKMASGYSNLPTNIRTVACEAYLTSSDKKIIKKLKNDVGSLEKKKVFSKLNQEQITRLSGQKNIISNLKPGIDCSAL